MSNATVFMVAEKPSLAESIAKSLSRCNQLTNRRSISKACAVHEWHGTFQGQKAFFKMTAVCGHLMAVDFNARYNNWNLVDPAELFVAPIEKKESNPKLNLIAHLQKEAKAASVVILWLDCDKEGENICFEVLDCISHVISPQCRILRAQFSAITDKELQSAMQTLRLPNKNEAASVDARQELDLRIGCSFTRFQTKFFQGKYGDLNSNLISYGPCQTPTLGFCVKRYDRIQSFQPEPFWRIKASLTLPSSSDIVGGQQLDLVWSRDRIFDKEAASALLNLIKSSTSAVVVDVTRKAKVKQRPLGLNTVEMLRIASSYLGIGPHATMSLAERLYTSGYINYPRTETTSYPPGFDLKGLVQQQTRHPSWGHIASELQSGGQPRKGHDAGDHPPIAPMRCVTNPSGELGHDAGRLYELIAKNFLASLMPDCKYESTQVTLSIGTDDNDDAGSETFTLTSTQTIDPGYTRLLSWQALPTDQPCLPNDLLVVGSRLSLSQPPSLAEGRTQAPDLLTEADLISCMESHGIGTDASIPTHIENIIQRGYVQLVPGRRLEPTRLGIVLVHGYQAIDPDLVLPYMRKAVEQQLNLIAVGRANLDSVVKHVVVGFVAKYRYFVQHIPLMDQLFEASFSSLADTGKPMSKCGKCSRYMKLIEQRPQRLHCSFCSETYTVPQNGNIRLYKEVFCPLDNFQLLSFSCGPKSKTTIFCPFCFSYPPFESMTKASGCNRCLHPTCPLSLESLAVDACVECDHGLMLLDDSLAPLYRFACNRCPVIIRVSSAIKYISLGSTYCSRCTAKEMTVKLDRSKLKPVKPDAGGGGDDGQEADSIGSNFTGCLFCSPRLANELSLVREIMTKPVSSNRGKGSSSSNQRGGGGRGSRGNRRPRA